MTGYHPSKIGHSFSQWIIALAPPATKNELSSTQQASGPGIAASPRRKLGLGCGFSRNDAVGALLVAPSSGQGKPCPYRTRRLQLRSTTLIQCGRSKSNKPFEKRFLPRPLSKNFYSCSGLPVSSLRKPASQRVIEFLEGGGGKLLYKEVSPGVHSFESELVSDAS